MIRIRSLGLQLGSKVLLDGADLTVYPGQKWGVIGPNGSGKSSLFQLLLGTVQADTGECFLPKDWTLAHMAQEVDYVEKPALDYVLDGDRDLRELQRKIAQEPDGETLAKLYARLETISGYTAPARAQRLLNGLGFEPGDDQRSVKAFSGGWRIRLNLAKALMCRSDLLLLDEPTNHLDLDATMWLESWLQQYKGTLLIVSHDRDFLDSVVDGVVSFEDAKLVAYSGNYSAYERQRAERLAQQSAAFAKQQERIKDIENFVRRFRAKATKAKQAQSRLKELERMEKVAPAHLDSPFTFRFPAPEKVPQQLLNLTDATIGYGATPIVENLEFSLQGQSRLGLLGHNGAGKSTLMKTLAGAVPLLAGEMVEGAHLRIGYFAQHQLEALDMAASCALHLQRLSPRASEQQIRNFLGGFDFQGERAFEPIRHFSGGEKARLALAILAWQKPNLLLLDEPTNHLDLEVRHALTIALQEFEGAIVVVSHDRHLLRNTVDEFVLVDGGRVQPFDGDLRDYQDWLLKSRDEETPEQSSGPGEQALKPDKKEQRQLAAAVRDKLKPHAQRLKTVEKSMEKTQAKLDEIEQRLAEPSLYENAQAELTDLLKRQGECKQALEALEAEWLEKGEEYETLKASLEG